MLKVKNTSDYWIKMLVPIILFTITIGFRYGWLLDFTIYEYDYNHQYTIDLYERYGWLVAVFFQIGDYIGLNFNLILVVFTIALLCFYIKYLQPYKQYLGLILAVFYLDNFFICQFISFYPAITAFALFIGTHLQLDNKFDFRFWKNTPMIVPLFFLFIAFAFHKAIILALPIYFIILFHKFKPFYCIVVYGLSFLFVNDWWFSIIDSITGWISMLTVGVFSRFQYFSDGAESFWHDEWGFAEDYSSPLVKFSTFFANSTAIFLYNLYTRKIQIDVEKTKILELSTIGLVLNNITWGVQLLERYAFLFKVFTPIMLVFGLAYGIKQNNKLYRIISSISIIILLFSYYKIICSYDNPLYKYVWDY